MINILEIKESRILTLLICLLFLTANVTCINLGGLSFSFPIGIILIIYCICYHRDFFIVKKRLVPLLLFSIFGCISLLISPIGFPSSSCYTILQLIYWFLLSNIISNSLHIINLKSISDTFIFILIVLFCITFINPMILSENETSYIIVALWPISLLFLRKLVTIPYILFIILFSIINDSRTGMILILFQLFLYFILLIDKRHNIIKKVTIIFVISVLVLSFSGVRNFISTSFFHNKPLISLAINNPSMIFSFDKSWAQRQLQIQKCKQIFEDYPIFGIGPLNAKEYNVNINTNNISNVDYDILSSEYLNSINRSTHNSFFEILAETGLVGFFLICYLLFSSLFSLLRLKKRNDINILCIVSLSGLIINLYMVSSFFGTHTWIMLGFISGITSSFTENKTSMSISI